AHDSNGASYIVGLAYTSAFRNRVASLHDGTEVHGLPGALRSFATAANTINASSQIIGLAATDRLPFRAVRYDRSGLHDLGTFGGVSSSARDINDAGQIVGTADIPGGSNRIHAFL